MTISISPFVIEAYEDVLGLWQQCAGIGLSDADSRANIQSYLERNPGMSFVARSDGQIVGAILAGHDGRRGYIHHLAVHPDFRRHGLGRQLVDGCLDVLKKAGIQKCHIFIFNGNADGIAFWASAGWERRTDIGVMSKTLVSGTGGAR
jgi:ribosomal protein S18 acetylase RimI-like enzyme